MSKRLWFCAVLVTSTLIGPVMAQSLVPIDPITVTNGHVYLMDNVGANLPDDSANSNNGTLVGSPQVVPGLNGNALRFNGATDGVAVPDATTINTSTHQNKTMIAVFSCADVSKTSKQVVFEEGGSTRGVNIYVHQGLAYAGAWNRGDYTPDFPGTWLSAPIGSNEWHVVAAVLRGGTAGQADDKFEMWMDGELIAKGPGGELRSRSDDNAIGNVQQQTRVHNAEVLNAGNWFEGTVDEIWILNTALSEAELADIKIGPAAADDPVPADGTVDVPRDVALAWKPVASAGTRDVYVGTAFDDVSTASRADPMGVLASQGQAEVEYEPAGLEYGQTYYWRIDEVNATPDNTIFQGEIWSFTVEPYAYPIANVTATASSAQAGMEPQNTVNGSGLDASDQHSTSEKEMWLSDGTQPNWIQFEFDQTYKLHELWVWNSNQIIEAFIGFGAKDVTIESSLDGKAWTALDGVFEFARAPGASTYTHNATVPLGGVVARYVRLTITSSWGGLPQAGLSEVRFFHVPVQAFGPEPAVAATGVSVDAELNWRPGREAESHEVHLGADADALTLEETVTAHQYAPAALDYGATYFWKVNEVGGDGPYEGEIWSFTTQEYAVIDDMESYNDDGNRIYDAWIDGLTDTAMGGSQVGYDVSPFAEKTIVHGGGQSLPLKYDNTGVSFAEAKQTFASGQNWTARGIQALSLHFAGDPGNGGQLYVKINNTKVLYDGAATDLARTAWQAWNIDLSKVGGVNNVRSLTVGVEGAGAAGTLYIDDIRLYPKAPEYIIPVQPAGALVAYYPLDGDYKDVSGNGRNGTATGGPSFAAGQSGQVVSFDGTGDYITIDAWQGILGGNPFTISLWVNSTALDDRTMVCWGSATNGQRVDFRLYQGRLRVEHGNGNLQGNTVLADGEWHHAALVVTQDAPIQQPQVTLYLDGLNDSQATADPDVFGIVADVPVTIGQRRTNNDRDFQGMLDEVRIFDRVLSDDEVAWLAGRRAPMHKSF